MLTIHLDLVNHKLLSKLRIYENIWIKNSVAYLISVLVPIIPDTSGRYTGHVRNTQNRNIFSLSLAIPDMSDRCRTETNNSLLVILRLALLFIVYLHLNK